MEPTFLFVGHCESDVALFRDAVANLDAAAVWEVPRALDLICDGALTGLVVADDIGHDSAERVIALARHVQPDLPVIYLGTPTPPVLEHAHVVVERPLRASELNAALGHVATPVSRTRIRVASADALIVDADARFVQGLEDSLRREGHSAMRASARDARSLVQTTQFGVLVLDVESGVELARSLRDGALGSLNQHAPIVFLTDGRYSAAYEQTFELDALRCIVKRVGANAICGIVGELLHAAAA